MNQNSTEFDPQQLFETAFAAHCSGDIDSAEAHYRKILLAQPENSNVAHLLGVIALQKGRFHDACELIAAAIQRDDSQAPFHCNLGEAHRLLGELDEAEKCFCVALEKQARYPQALTNLGTTLHQLGRYAEAVSRFQQVLDLDGPSADAFNNLGLAQLASGDADAAASSLRKAVELNPHDGETSNNLGAALLEKGDLEAAAVALKNAVSVSPGLADAWCNLALVMVGQSAPTEAEEYARRAIELAPDMGKCHYVLGLILDYAERPNEAELPFKRSLELAPGEPMAHHALGAIYLRVGRFEEAEASLKSALALKPELTVAYEGLAEIRSYGIDDLPEIERLETLAEHLPAESSGRICAGFALAKMFEDCCEFDRAFSHLQKANELKQSQVRFDAAEPWRILEDTKRTVNRDLIQQMAHFGSSSEVPILIAGMPRSGTTLVEQILASHPEVSGAGETGYLSTVAQNLALASGVAYPVCLRELNESVIRDLIAEYLERLESYRGDARCVVDKTPHNFIHLGLFSMLFPRARIIHCSRDPRDTCFSLYTKNFVKENEYANDLRHVAEFYRLYRMTMEHWQSTLPGRIFDVSYEELVDDQERVSRDLLEYCGLPWDDRCLRPHETDREIRTASFWQVRQPVYAKSVERWQRFERHLGPLIDALGDYAPEAKKA